MEKSTKVKKEKKFSMPSFITWEIFILYITMNIGDSFISSESGILYTRYLPVGIVTLLMTFLLVKNNAKKCFQTEKEGYERKVMLIPLIVALIIFAYGLINVHSNVKNYQEKIDTYSMLFTSFDEEYSKIMEDSIAKTKKEAIQVWLITSVIYLVVAEGSTFMLKGKLDKYYKENEVLEANEEVIPVEEDRKEPESVTNQINWNL